MRTSFSVFCAICFACTLIAAGETYPRDTLVYAECSDGAELRNFINLDAWLPLDLQANESEFKSLTAVVKNASETLQSASLAITSLDFDEYKNIQPKLVAHFKYSKNVDLDLLFKPFLERDGKVRKFEYVEYAGSRYTRLDDLFVSAIGSNFLAASSDNAMRDLIDAHKKNKAIDEVLSSSERFQIWEAASIGNPVRAWVDLKAVGKEIDRAFTPKEGQEPQRSFVEDHGNFMASRAFEWDRADSASLTGSLVKDSKLHVNLSMSKPLEGMAAIVPAPTTFTSFKYLPETAMMAGGVSIPKVAALSEAGLETMRLARRNALAAAPNYFENRNVFDIGGLGEASRALREFEMLLLLGFKRIAEDAQSRGLAMPWNGTPAEFEKEVGEGSLPDSFFGFTIRSFVALDFDREKGEVSGAVQVVDAMGFKMDIAFVGEEVLMDKEAGVVESRTLTFDQAFEGLFGIIEFAFGITMKESEKYLGSHAILGLATDRTFRLGTDYVRSVADERGIFGILQIQNASEFEGRLAKAARVLPDNVRRYITSDEGKRIKTIYEENGIRVVLRSEDFCVAISQDALLVGRPGVVAQMMSKSRPAHILKKTGKAPKASAVFAVDFQTFREGRNLGELSMARWGRDPSINASIWAKATLTPSAFAFEVNQPFNSLRDLMLLDRKYQDYRFENRLLPMLRELADVELSRRKRDADPENDTLPSVQDAIVMRIRRDFTRAEGDMPFNINYVVSQTFGGTVDSHWKFFESSRACDAFLGDRGEITAVSKKEHNGRFLAIVDSEVISLAPYRFEQLLALRKAENGGPHKSQEYYEIERVGRLDAALSLAQMWEQRALGRLRQLYSGTLPTEGETISIPGVCKAKIEIASETLSEIRLEGFGHWAVYSSDFGLVEASWFPKEEKGD